MIDKNAHIARWCIEWHQNREKTKTIIDLFHKPTDVKKLFNGFYLLNYFYRVYYRDIIQIFNN